MYKVIDGVAIELTADEIAEIEKAVAEYDRLHPDDGSIDAEEALAIILGGEGT